MEEREEATTADEPSGHIGNCSDRGESVDDGELSSEGSTMSSDEDTGSPRLSLTGTSISDPSTRGDPLSVVLPMTAGDDALVAIQQRATKGKNCQPNDFLFLKQIGEGAFSTVYRVREVKTNDEYAIKVVVKAQIQKERKTELVVREKNVLALLTYGHGGHPFVVSLYCTFQDRQRLYFVMSYASRGDLRDTLTKVGCFDLSTTRFFTAEIVSALDFIHGCGIAHRDLKPENILIQASGHIAISDFGSAKILSEVKSAAENADPAKDDEPKTPEDERQERVRRATFVGTAQYVSPEMLCGIDVGIECDYWALGAIVYQMLSGQPPFRAVNDYHLLNKIQHLDYAFPPGFPDEPADFVKKLLVLDPKLRLGTEGQPSLSEHPFLSSVNFSELPRTTPAPIHPYVPASMGEPEFYSELTFEPGFDERTMNRLVLQNLTEGIGVFELNSPETDLRQSSTGSTESKGTENVNPNALKELPMPKPEPPPEHKKSELVPVNKELIREYKLKKQRRDNTYHKFVDDNLILRSGLIDKKKGLFARRRMFLLTEGPHLYYIDPVAMEPKGEIPLSYTVTTEVKNFKTFFVHTPDRTYYLFDPERKATEWCDAIDKICREYFPEPPPEGEETVEPKKKKKKNISPPWSRSKNKKNKDKEQKPPKEKTKEKEKKATSAIWRVWRVPISMLYRVQLFSE